MWLLVFTASEGGGGAGLARVLAVTGTLDLLQLVKLAGADYLGTAAPGWP